MRLRSFPWPVIFSILVIAPRINYQLGKAGRVQARQSNFMSQHEESVRQANQVFYRAFESLDLAAMEAVWHRAPQIVCVHPGWRPLTGWGPIMNSWEQIFDSMFEAKFELAEVQLTVRDDVAVMVLEEQLTQRDYDGTTHAAVITTNVFERVGEQWKLVLHHGSPVAMPPDSVPRIQ